MITDEVMTELAQGKRPSFVFLHDGEIQYWSQLNKPGLLVATNREAADAFAMKLTAKKGSGVAVAEVAAMPGATLANLIASAVVEGGAVGIYATDDGKTVYFFQPPSLPSAG
jgi:hypothetical protein